jgi:hypothetical protein
MGLRLPRNAIVCPRRENANEHEIGAQGEYVAERQPTLPVAEREESAETSGDREVVGVLVDSVKTSGWALSEDRRRERWERRVDACVTVTCEDRHGCQFAEFLLSVSAASPHNGLMSHFTTLMHRQARLLTFNIFSLHNVNAKVYCVRPSLRSRSQRAGKIASPISANTLIQNRRRRSWPPVSVYLRFECVPRYVSDVSQNRSALRRTSTFSPSLSTEEHVDWVMVRLIQAVPALISSCPRPETEAVDDIRKLGSSRSGLAGLSQSVVCGRA